MMNGKIILVEDDHELASLVHDYLNKNGYEVKIVGSGLVAVEQIPVLQPDLVILDIMLPGINGMDVCREVRPRFSGPILMLTALDDDMDQMLGLELGADDYIIKPIQPRLLLTRIRTLLRRIPQAQQASGHAELNSGNLKINFGDRTVLVNGDKVDLSTAEFELLLLLAADIGSVVDRNTIVRELRGFDYDGFDRSIDRRISRLRKKLMNGGDQDFIKTVRGQGYQLCIDTL